MCTRILIDNREEGGISSVLCKSAVRTWILVQNLWV